MVALTLVRTAIRLASLIFLQRKKKKENLLFSRQLASAQTSRRLLCNVMGLLRFSFGVELVGVEHGLVLRTAPLVNAAGRGGTTEQAGNLPGMCH